jgi:3-dehydroquinate dehydratase II
MPDQNQIYVRGRQLILMKTPLQGVVIINGPNLNLLGIREPEIYGNMDFESYFWSLKQEFTKLNLTYYQSNHEGVLIDLLQQYGFNNTGIILNPAAYTHTSIAIADTIKAIHSPVIEVHISDISTREDFRKISYIRPHCLHLIKGQGLEGYRQALEYFLNNYDVEKRIV